MSHTYPLATGGNQNMLNAVEENESAYAYLYDAAKRSNAIVNTSIIWMNCIESSNAPPSTTTSIGSFTRDPIGFGGGSNLYEYVNGMPLSMFDPTGYCAKSCNIKDFKLKEDGCKEYKNTLKDGTVLNGYGYSFSVDLTFAEPCECCSYRQYMKGSQSIEYIIKGKVTNTIPLYPIPGPPGGPKPPEWEEDCVIVEVPDPARPGRKKKVKNCYGNRNAAPKENDKYTDKGCGYHMHDIPGLEDLSILG